MPPADRASHRPARQASGRGALRVPAALISDAEAAVASTAVVLASAVLKGAIGFGFPTLGTPLLALVVDVKTAVALLILPNIVMDLIQGSRHGKLVPTIQRFAVLVLFGAIGTVVGTRLLTAISSRTATLVLGVTVVTFVVLNATRWSPRVSPGAEPWADVPVGLAAGVIGGVTNVPGTPLVMYFYALGLRKRDFVRAVAVTFVLFKVAQLGAVAWYGLLTVRTLELSALLTLVALLGFWLGVKIQDRLVQETFNRVVLVCLALLGVWLIVRAQM